MTSSSYTVVLPSGVTHTGFTIDVRRTQWDTTCWCRVLRHGGPQTPHSPCLFSPPPSQLQYVLPALTPDIRVSRRACLLAIGADRGLPTPYDAALQSALTGRHQAIQHSTTPGFAALRREVAELTHAVERAREKAAARRGALSAFRTHGQEDSTDSVYETYQIALQELAETETAYAAATQRLETAIKAARERRTARESCMQHADSINNLRRRIRQHRLAILTEEFKSQSSPIQLTQDDAISLSAAQIAQLNKAVEILQFGTTPAPIIVEATLLSALDTPEMLITSLGGSILVTPPPGLKY